MDPLIQTALRVRQAQPAAGPLICPDASTASTSADARMTLSTKYAWLFPATSSRTYLQHCVLLCRHHVTDNILHESLAAACIKQWGPDAIQGGWRALVIDHDAKAACFAACR